MLPLHGCPATVSLNKGLQPASQWAWTIAPYASSPPLLCSSGLLHVKACDVRMHWIMDWIIGHGLHWLCILQVLLRLAEDSRFVDGVAGEPDYEEPVLRKAHHILTSKQLGEYEHAARLDTLIAQVSLPQLQMSAHYSFFPMWALHPYHLLWVMGLKPRTGCIISNGNIPSFGLSTSVSMVWPAGTVTLDSLASRHSDPRQSGKICRLQAWLLSL